MSATLALLRPLPLFNALTSEELGKIAELCESKSFESGEYIFREGEPGNRLFIIVDGDVRISRQIPGAGEEALAVLKRGAMFGEMAVFDRS
ncbi:MAG: cyclic nucleotide-binding domain-containing protein, partial [Gemmatimonadota bacterium]